MHRFGPKSALEKSRSAAKRRNAGRRPATIRSNTRSADRRPLARYAALLRVADRRDRWAVPVAEPPGNFHIILSRRCAGAASIVAAALIAVGRDASTLPGLA
eukprot:6186326-Pleurochrysis_carterae.AAC.4